MHISSSLNGSVSNEISLALEVQQRIKCDLMINRFRFSDQNFVLLLFLFLALTVHSYSLTLAVVTGMSFSLQSRDVIADSIETVMGGQWYDGNIAIPGCDKNMPGCLIAMGRVNRPAIMVRIEGVRVLGQSCWQSC